MARVELRRPRAHPLGIEALEVRIESAVALGDHIPGWDRLPGGSRHRPREVSGADRLLRRRQNGAFRSGKVLGEQFGETRPIDDHETRRILLERPVCL